MRKKKNKILSIVLALSLIFSSVSLIFADDVTDKRNELTDINDKIGDKTDEIKDAKAKSTALSKEISTLEKKIYASETEIANIEEKINNTKDEISKVLKELDDMQCQLNQQDDSLNLRLRAMYKNGDVGLLAVLLGSKSMADFVNNIEMAKRVYASDADVLSSLEGKYEAIDQKRMELADLKDYFDLQQENAKKKSEELEANKATLDKKKSSIDKDVKLLQAELDAFEKEANALTAEILRLQGDGDYIGGGMLWPAEKGTRITSPFGTRTDPINGTKSTHSGIDIGGAPKGSNILAANSGKVIKAAYNSSYGYFVMIDHGGGIVTLYAHSSKLLVKAGDVVVRGDTIALIGSTGRSTGPHLHFEVRINGKQVDPQQYVSLKNKKK